MPKTEFLQIRMTPESRSRLSRVAEADHLDESTWARRAILQALDRWEAGEPQDRRTEETSSEKSRLHRVAESKPPSATKERDKQASRTRSKSPTKSPTKRKPRK